MSLANTFRSQTVLSRFWMALALVCLLGAQISGFTHRVAHGDGFQASQNANQGLPPLVHDGHNCQLFDALTLASFSGTGASLPVMMALPNTFLVARPLFFVLLDKPLWFRSRAPPFPLQQI